MLTASIIIPSNRPDFIAETMQSIANQTVKPKEVFILYPTAVYDSAGRRMNKGIGMSTADTFICLGDDDKLDPTYLEKTLKLMEQTNADIVYTDMEEFGDRQGQHTGSEFTKKNLEERLVCFFTSLVRKSMWERIGGYDVNAGPHLDWDFWWRCGEVKANAQWLHEPLFKYRVHNEQDSQTCKDDIKLWSRKYILNKHELLDYFPHWPESQYYPNA